MNPDSGGRNAGQPYPVGNGAGRQSWEWFRSYLAWKIPGNETALSAKRAPDLNRTRSVPYADFWFWNSKSIIDIPVQLVAQAADGNAEHFSGVCPVSLTPSQCREDVLSFNIG
jgi:hypothetical protein